MDATRLVLGADARGWCRVSVASNDLDVIISMNSKNDD